MIREVLSQALLALAIGLLAAVVGLGGLGFLAAALYLMLETLIQPWAAAAATGGALLVVTAILLLVCRAVMSGGRTRSPGGAAGPTDEVEALTQLANRLGPQLRRRLPLLAGLTFAAGFVVGLKPAARRALWRLLTQGR